MMPAATLTEQLLDRVRIGYAPTPALTVSEFSDADLVVTTGPLSGTRWRTDFAPYQRGILDVFHEVGVQIAVVMGSSQWGKTSSAVNLVAYHIAYDPCPILVVEPTVDPMAKDFAKNRMDPLIAAVPKLRDAVSKKRAKDASNTTLQKTFRGGSLAIGGANSAASLAARTTRLLILDEIDRYPAELPGEGNTIAVALKRTSAYKRRRRILMLSSPTLKGAAIHAWFLRGDQRKYFVPCPTCGVMHPFEWSQVQWVNDDPRTARLLCPGCAAPISEAQRLAILAKGEWRPTRKAPTETSATTEEAGAEEYDPTIVSFHLWEAYSPLSSLVEIVRGFLRARAAQKTGDRSEMHTWQNTTLGEPIEPDAGEGVEPHALLIRREVYAADVPGSACCLTMGVDVQDDRLELLVFGWGPGEESWIVDRQTLPGDTEQAGPWAMLDAVLDQPYRHAGGQRLFIQSTCIDSAGHRTTLVYDYVERRAARRVFAIIGRDGQRPIVSSPSARRWGRTERQVPLYTVGVDAAKALFISRLKITERGPGCLHLPEASWCDDELAAQLTSERLVMKWHKGLPTQVWRKLRTRNEALDCAVYAIAALRLLNPKLTIMAEQLAALSDPSALPPAPKPGRRTGRSSYMGGGS